MTTEALSSPSFSQPEMQRRWDLVHSLLREKDLSALIVYGWGRFQPDLLWLTDWPGGREGYALFPSKGDPALLVQFFNHLPTARQISQMEDVRWAGPVDAHTLAALIREKGLETSRIGIAGRLPWSTYLALREKMPDATFEDVQAPYRTLRLIRSGEEIRRFEVAGRLTDDSMRALEAGLSAGLGEDRIPALLEPAYLAGGGYSGIHYVATMPMDGPYSGVPSQYPSSRLLAPGDVVITEVTGCYWGYQGQIHRTYSLGRGPSFKWRHLHDTAVLAFERILSVLRPGARAEDVMRAADVIHERGLTVRDDLFHGADQMPPVLRTHQTDHQPYPKGFRFEANMVVTIQPNPVDPVSGMGLQFGETVIVTPDGPISLHDYPREWIILP